MPAIAHGSEIATRARAVRRETALAAAAVSG